MRWRGALLLFVLSSLIRQITSRKRDLWLLPVKWTGPVLGIVGALIAAHNLAPEDLGVLQAITLIPTYVGFLPFGVFNGSQP
jgi:hypothetical protein